MLLPGPNAGFAYATPVGLTIAAVIAAISSVDLQARRSASVLQWSAWLRAALVAAVVGWGVVSLADLPPLAGAPSAEKASGPLSAAAVLSVLLFTVAAWRYYLLYRRRRAVVLMSVITAYVLLAESMVAIALAPNWHVSWWEWHLLMLAGFMYVAYSAHVQYRREGAAAGLFDAVGAESTVRQVQAEYGAALESLVSAVRRREQGMLSADEMALITAGLAGRFGLTEGQTAVLGRAAAALASEREQTRRLDALVALGRQSRVRSTERDLLRAAVDQVAAGFDQHVVRVGLLDNGRVVFPDELSTAPGPLVDPEVERAVAAAMASGVPVGAQPGTLVLPLTVKEHPAGVLVVGHGGAVVKGRDLALLASLASQLSIGLENARLYRQLDVLFRQYMSPTVAAALIADPSQAALGGAVFEVTLLFADLSGFSTFSERSSPGEIVAVLNRYFDAATSAILVENGTIVQYVGDALVALFNAPIRQPDHPVRAARAALAMQRGVDAVAAGSPDWPRFRVGVNTGEALVGNIGSEVLRNFNATGDAVNVAARLQEVASPGQVVIGGATYRAIGDLARVTSLGELAVKGRSQPVDAYLLHRLDG